MATGKNRVRSPLVRLTVLGMLAAVSLVLVYFNFPVFPTASWLKLDFADVPILICSLLFGPLPSLAVLFAVSVVQAFMLGGDAFYGCIMHFVASGAMVVVAGCVCRKNKTLPRLILGLVAGALTMTAVMIPMNYLITPLHTGMGYTEAAFSMISGLMLPVLIPFNLIKSFANCILAAILFRSMFVFFVRRGLLSPGKTESARQ